MLNTTFFKNVKLNFPSTLKLPGNGVLTTPLGIDISKNTPVGPYTLRLNTLMNVPGKPPPYPLQYFGVSQALDDSLENYYQNVTIIQSIPI